MKMDCSKSHSKCKASCCGCFPMPKEIFERNKDKIVTHPIETKEMNGPDLAEDLSLEVLGKDIATILPITPNLKCVFLKEDYSCNIYEDRPRLCRKFGDETHPCMTCVYQDKNGRCRSRQETRYLNRKMDKYTDSERLRDVLKILK